MQVALGHLTLGRGGMNHGTVADADAGMFHAVAGIALEEDQIAGLQILHGGDQLPAFGLRESAGVASADVVAALLETIIYEAGAIEGVRAFRAPLIGLAQLDRKSVV